MNPKKYQKVLSQLLLIFAIFSIGFAVGKHCHKPPLTPIPIKKTKDQKPHIIVYYLHSTFRCKTCNTIETMSHDLLQKRYQPEIDNKTIIWQEIDFQKNETLAKQFNISASCLVIAKIKNGKVDKYNRLDEVWTKMKNPLEFEIYLSIAINNYLKELEETPPCS